MKSLIEYIEESLLDDIDTLSKNVDDGIKQKIKQFLKDNFKGRCKISKNPSSSGKYIVDCKGDVMVKNKSITSLVNDYFVWGKVGGSFYCQYCNSLTSLEGAPKEVGGDFWCSNCDKLTSLEGAPKEVQWGFICWMCRSLTSLEGAPKEVGGGFDCSSCNSLKSLEGAPEKVGGGFGCGHCTSLTSLEGAPKEVGGDFRCNGCTSLKSYDIDSNIKGEFIK